MFDIIKGDLKNFPDEIVRDWLEPFAKNIGWPPVMAFRSRWKGILRSLPLNVWQGVRWSKERIDLSKISLSSDSKCINQQLVEAHIQGIENAYSKIENGHERFLRALHYLINHGSFPKPIIFLINGTVFDIVDGNHRFLAWYTHKQFYSAMQKIPQQDAQDLKKKLCAKWGIPDISVPSDEQEVWCGYIGS